MPPTLYYGYNPGRYKYQVPYTIIVLHHHSSMGESISLSQVGEHISGFTMVCDSYNYS